MNVDSETTQSATDLPQLRARLAALKSQAEQASATIREARAKMIAGDDSRALKTFTEARATSDALSEAIAELERRIMALESEAEAEKRAAKREQVLAKVARDARQEEADERELCQIVARLYCQVEKELARAAELMAQSTQRQNALLDSARQLGGTVPEFIELDGQAVSTAKISAQSRQGQLLAAFEQEPTVYAAPMRTLLNEVIYQANRRNR